MNVLVQTGEPTKMLTKGRGRPSPSTQEVMQLKTEMASVVAQRDFLRQALHHLEVRLVAERKFHMNFEGERQNFESHITELHYVIAELKREINILKQRNVMEEEKEEISHLSSPSVTSGDISEGDGENEEAKDPDCADSVKESWDKDLEGKEATPSVKDFGTEKPGTLESLHPLTPISPKLENRKDAINSTEAIREESLVELNSIQNEIGKIRKEQSLICKSLQKREAELQAARKQLLKIGTERDELREKVSQLELLMSPKTNQSEAGIPNASPDNGVPVPKVAEKVKLNKLKNVNDSLSPSSATNLLNNNYLDEKGTEERKVSKSMFDLIPTCSPVSLRLVHHLVEPIQNESIIKEGSSGNGQERESVIRELVVAKERLAAQVGHLTAENEVLRLNLENSKETSDALYQKMGQCESNDMALRLLLKSSDEAIEAYDVLVALFESELGQLILSCRAAGIGQDSVELEHLLGRAYENRLIAHTVANALLQRKLEEEDTSSVPVGDHSSHPKGLTYNCSAFGRVPSESKLSSPASSSGCESGEIDMKSPEFPNPEYSLEGRIRDLIIDLKRERENLRSTLLEVNWNQEPDEGRVSPNLLECRRMDLETALLMQELMYVREERAELKSQLFLTEKENGVLRNSVRVAATEKLILKTKLSEVGNSNSSTPTADETNGNPPPELAPDSNVAAYKGRIAELLGTLDQVMESSAERGRQDSEMIRELKEAHLDLLATLENTKVKYRARIQKLEEYVLLVMEKRCKKELKGNCI